MIHIPSRSGKPSFPGASGNKVEAYKNASRLASGVDVDKNIGGFTTTTHYPNAKSVTAVHTSLHSVNSHLRSTLGASKFTRNE